MARLERASLPRGDGPRHRAWRRGAVLFAACVVMAGTPACRGPAVPTEPTAPTSAPKPAEPRVEAGDWLRDDFGPFGMAPDLRREASGGDYPTIGSFEALERLIAEGGDAAPDVVSRGPGALVARSAPDGMLWVDGRPGGTPALRIVIPVDPDRVAPGHRAKRAAITCLDWSPDGSRLAVGGFRDDDYGSKAGFALVVDVAAGTAVSCVDSQGDVPYQAFLDGDGGVLWLTAIVEDGPGSDLDDRRTWAAAFTADGRAVALHPDWFEPVRAVASARVPGRITLLQASWHGEERLSTWDLARGVWAETAEAEALAFKPAPTRYLLEEARSAFEVPTGYRDAAFAASARAPAPEPIPADRIPIPSADPPPDGILTGVVSPGFELNPMGVYPTERGAVFAFLEVYSQTFDRRVLLVHAGDSGTEAIRVLLDPSSGSYRTIQGVSTADALFLSVQEYAGGGIGVARVPLAPGAGLAWQVGFDSPASGRGSRSDAHPRLVPADDGGCWVCFTLGPESIAVVRLGADGALAWSREIVLPDDTFTGDYPYIHFATAGSGNAAVLLALCSTDVYRGEGNQIDLAFMAVAADGRSVKAWRLGENAEGFRRGYAYPIRGGFARGDSGAAILWNGREPRLALSGGSLPPLPGRAVQSGVETAFSGFVLVDRERLRARAQAYAGGPDPGEREAGGRYARIFIDASSTGPGGQAIVAAAAGRLGALPIGAGIVGCSSKPWEKGFATLGEVRLPAPPVRGSAWKRVVDGGRLDARLTGGGVTAVTFSTAFRVERDPEGVWLLPYGMVE